MKESQSVTQWLDVVHDIYDCATDPAPLDANEEIYQRIVAGAADIFSCDVARFAVAEQEYLVPAASTNDESITSHDPLPTTTGYAGKAYQSGTVDRIADLTDTRAAARPRGSTETVGPNLDSNPPFYRSLMSIPIPDFGILQLFATESDTFSADDEDAAALFATHVRSALKHVEAQTEIRQERNRFKEFADIVSHDLRNPLQILRGTLDATRETENLDHLDRGFRAIDRMECLIDDLLLLAQQGAEIGETEIIALETITTNCWANSATADATLLVTTDASLRADPIRLKQLLENLFRNAIEHGAADVTVTVGNLENGFYVMDDGPGISVDEDDTIFTSGYSTKPDGTGLGLAIVAEIVQAHGWSIAVTEGEDGGARFEITSVDLAG